MDWLQTELSLTCDWPQTQKIFYDGPLKNRYFKHTNYSLVTTRKNRTTHNLLNLHVANQPRNVCIYFCGIPNCLRQFAEPRQGRNLQFSNIWLRVWSKKKNKKKLRPPQCTYFIITIISYQINPAFCFPGKSWLRFRSFISQLQWIKQQGIPCRKGSRKIVDAYFARKSVIQTVRRPF